MTPPMWRCYVYSLYLERWIAGYRPLARVVSDESDLIYLDDEDDE